MKTCKKPHRVCLVVVSDNDVWHGEEGRVHDACWPREDQNTPFGSGEGHKDHAHAIHQLATYIDGFGPKFLDQLLHAEGIDGARHGVASHPPAPEADALVV